MTATQISTADTLATSPAPRRAHSAPANESVGKSENNTLPDISNTTGSHPFNVSRGPDLCGANSSNLCALWCSLC